MNTQSGTIIIYLYTSLSDNNYLTLSPVISVTKLPSPTYNIIANKSQVLIGNSIVFTINTTNVANNTAFFIKNVGQSVNTDFIGDKDYGYVLINNNTASITFILKNTINFNSKTIIMNLYTNNQNNTILAQSPIIQIIGPTYNITSNLISVSENQTLTYTITTTNLPNNTRLFISNSGTSNASDFTTGIPTIIVINNNTATFKITTKNDKLLEGVETIILNLRLNNNNGPIVATSQIVYIQDTSFPPPIFNLSSMPSLSVIEGNSVQFNLSTANVPNNTILYWDNTGTSNEKDFSQNIKNGTLIINNNRGSLILNTLYDKITEPTESIILNIRQTINGPIVATKTVYIVNSK
jgi:hypothetical protein